MQMHECILLMFAGVGAEVQCEANHKETQQEEHKKEFAGLTVVRLDKDKPLVLFFRE